MDALSAERLLAIWERCLTKGPVERPVAILVEAGFGDLAALREAPLGTRDAHLLRLRERLFGGRVVATITCSACGDRVELQFSCADLRHDRDPEVVGAHVSAPRVRPVTTADLAAVSACATQEQARAALARRCLLTTRDEDEEMMSEEMVRTIGEELERADPDAACVLESTCPSCGVTAEYEFDVAQFLWAELEAEAMRLLRDVHVLARAYGWREDAILAMHPLRRRAYLELVQ